MKGSGRSTHQVDEGGGSLCLWSLVKLMRFHLGGGTGTFGVFFAPTQKLLGGRLDVQSPSVPSGPFVFVSIATQRRRSPDSVTGLFAIGTTVSPVQADPSLSEKLLLRFQRPSGAVEHRLVAGALPLA